MLVEFHGRFWKILEDFYYGCYLILVNMKFKAKLLKFTYRCSSLMSLMPVKIYNLFPSTTVDFTFSEMRKDLFHDLWF